MNSCHLFGRFPKLLHPTGLCFDEYQVYPEYK